LRRRRPLRLTISVWLVVLVAIGLLLWAGLPDEKQPATTSGGELLVAVLDVGQADSIFVRSPSGRTMLVDAGNERKDVEGVILPYLQRRGVSSLDYLVLTHPDQDHVGGMPALIDSLSVSTFVDPVHPDETNQAYLQTLQRVQRKGIKAVKARRGQTEIDLGADTPVQLLAPEDPLLNDDRSFNNANSIVLRIRFGSVGVLLTGDIEETTEDRLLGHHDDLHSQILKVPHHGSRYSSTPAFLDAVQPEVALVSAGEGNSYGHPHSQTLERFDQRGIELFRTDQQGTIEVVSDGQQYKITTAKKGG